MKFYLHDQTNSFAQLIEGYLAKQYDINIIQTNIFSDVADNHPMLVISDDTAFESKNIFNVKSKLSFPFHLSKLISFIVQTKQFDRSYKIGEILFYPSKQSIIHNNEIIKLTQIETNIIDMLVLSDNLAIAKNTISKEIFDVTNHIETNNIENHIYRINKKTPIKLINIDNGFCNLNDIAFFIF